MPLTLTFTIQDITMSETVFYKKVRRRYVPVSSYDHEVMDSVNLGAHLVVKRKGSTLRKYDIDPAFAPMIAAGVYAEDAISNSIMQASALRCPSQTQPLTPGQRAAWGLLAKEFGCESFPLQWPSYRESAEAGVKALQEEAEKLLSNSSVRTAYEHFMLMCKLTYQDKTSE